jgi:hypothetical protein
LRIQIQPHSSRVHERQPGPANYRVKRRCIRHIAAAICPDPAVYVVALPGQERSSALPGKSSPQPAR